MSANPRSVFIFWTASPGAFARAVIRITGRRLPDKSDAFSHMGFGFDYADHSEYYECLFSQGFTGPKPVDKLFRFEATGGRLCIMFVPQISPQDAACIKDAADSWVGKKGYYAWQLISMWSFERIGKYIGRRVPRSPNRLVCSEAVARLLYPYIDLRDEVRDCFDAVSPNSAYRRFLEICRDARKCPTTGEPPAGGLNTRTAGRSPICNRFACDFEASTHGDTHDEAK